MLVWPGRTLDQKIGANISTFDFITGIWTSHKVTLASWRTLLEIASNDISNGTISDTGIGSREYVARNT